MPNGTRERRTWAYDPFENEDALKLEAAVDQYVLGFVAQEVGWADRVPTHSDVMRDGAYAGP